MTKRKGDSKQLVLATNGLIYSIVIHDVINNLFVGNIHSSKFTAYILFA